jgi:hypothetical protein
MNTSDRDELYAVLRCGLPTPVFLTWFRSRGTLSTDPMFGIFRLLARCCGKCVVERTCRRTYEPRFLFVLGWLLEGWRGLFCIAWLIPLVSKPGSYLTRVYQKSEENMKRLLVSTVAFLVVLGLSAVAVSSAAAADLEVCGLAVPAKTGLYDARTSVVPDGCAEPLPTNKIGEFELYEIEFLLALWLEASIPVSSILPVQGEGELELVSLNGGGLGVVSKVLCSIVEDGWIGPESLDFFSEQLTLSGVAIPKTELTGTALLCTNDQNCTEPEVWPAKGGWETEAELAEVLGVGSFFVDLRFNSGWYVQCLVLGITVSESCSAAETAVELTNESNGTVDETFSDAFQQLTGLKLSNCSGGGSETGEANGLLVVLESGVSISVSSE